MFSFSNIVWFYDRIHLIKVKVTRRSSVVLIESSALNTQHSACSPRRSMVPFLSFMFLSSPHLTFSVFQEMHESSTKWCTMSAAQWAHDGRDSQSSPASSSQGTNTARITPPNTRSAVRGIHSASAFRWSSSPWKAAQSRATQKCQAFVSDFPFLLISDRFQAQTCLKNCSCSVNLLFKVRN